MIRSSQRSVLLLALLLLTAPLAAARRWVPLGPYGGSISRIAVDPSDARVVYTVTGNNVLFKSTDGGGNWSPLRMFDGFYNLVPDIAVDPARHGTIYVANGPELLKSVDGGASWKDVRPRTAVDISSVAVDPARPSRVYTGGGESLWVSTNRGASWTRARALFLSSSIQRLIAVRQPAGTVFATTYSGVYKSVDAGLTWSASHLPDGVREVGPFAVAPSDSQRLYASFGAAGLFRSKNGGASWQPTGRQREPGDWILSLAVSPHSPRTLWLVTEQSGLFRSTDGGDTWAARGPRPPGSVLEVDVAPSASGTVYAGLMAAGTDAGGVSASTDSGGTWVRRNQGLFGRGVSALTLDPGNPGIVWVGHWGGLYRSVAAGASWQGIPLPASPPPGYSFRSIVLDPAAPSSVVYALCNSLWQTVDGGASWTDLFAVGPHPDLRSLRMGPAAAPKLWGSDEERLYVSTDAGLHWVTRAQPELGCWISDFAFAPSSSSVLYMAGANGCWWNPAWPFCQTSSNYCDDSPSPAFFRSDDGGTTWSDLSADLQLHLLFAAGQRIAVDPVDPRLVYLATGGGYDGGRGDGVWKSSDGGATWQRAGDEMADQSVTAIAVSPVAGVVWAANDGGRIFRSGNSGASWRSRTEGLFAHQVYDLILDPADPSRVYAATSGGVWVWEDAP